jgi:DNA-binding NarL/FixJ family response regulator
MRILLCDRRRAVRDGLRVLLEKQGLEIVGEASTGVELIEQCRKLGPDVVVTDVSMPDLNGIDATRALLAEMPQLRVVGLSIAPDPCHVAAMFAAGAVAYLPKTADSAELVRTLRKLARSPKPAELRSTRSRSEPSEANVTAAHPAKPLSSRERDVLELIARGKSSKEIAAILDIGVTTVETHRRQITDKLGLRTIAELTKYAVRIGLVSLD